MGRLRQLWSLAKRAKEVWEWWAILSGLLPAIAVVWAVIQGAPFDVVILYIMAGVAYVVVIVCEMSTLRELVTPKIHDGVLWKVSSSREALDGPFCPTDTTPLGHQGIHGSRRKPKTEDSDYVGGFSE